MVGSELREQKSRRTKVPFFIILSFIGSKIDIINTRPKWWTRRKTMGIRTNVIFIHSNIQYLTMKFYKTPLRGTLHVPGLLPDEGHFGVTTHASLVLSTNIRTLLNHYELFSSRLYFYNIRTDT